MVTGIILIYLVSITVAGSFYINRMHESLNFIQILILSMLIPLDAIIFCLNLVLPFFKVYIHMQYAINVSDKSKEE